MDANSLVIGAFLDDDNGSDSGSAYTYFNTNVASLDLWLSSNSVTFSSTTTATITLEIPGITTPDAALAGHTAYLDTINSVGWPERVLGLVTMADSIF